MKHSVVVPCYNESGNIPLLFEKFLALAEAYPDIEIIFVNNGSTDNSNEVFERELLKYSTPAFRILNLEINHGYGFGILSGLKSATGNVLSWTHADLQTDPSDLLGYRLWQKENDTSLLVKGQRLKRKFGEAFFTFLMELIASAALGTRLSDINAQPKIFSRSFYESIVASAPNDFSLDLYFLYYAKIKGRIITFPVYFNKRIFGEAKGGGSFQTRIKLIKRTLTYIFKLRRELNSSNRY